MYLEKLEVQGFKTFAQKTALTFPKPKDDRHTITSVVGPNGSGKSNLSDAIRWALGEQSLKLLRGKKSEDVIFSGSIGRTQAGFAEVALTFNNEDGTMPVEFSQVTFSRKLFRDGNSEYRLNGKVARLSDIQLLLAQAGVGQRTYSVVGQGMVDHILVSSPEERKTFFDDATGVRQFQLKRHEAMLKLKRTYENLSEVELVLNEISPRLRSLKRQVNRLEKREQVENELRDMQASYYGTLWWTLTDQLGAVKKNFNAVDAEYRAAENKIKSLEVKSQKMESEEEATDQADAGMAALQNQYREFQAKRSGLRDQEFEIQKQIELKKVQAEAKWTPLPLPEIIKELETIRDTLKSVSEDAYEKTISSMLERSEKLLTRLKKPAPETIQDDPGLAMELKQKSRERQAVESELKRLEKQMEDRAKAQKEQRNELFEIGRQMRVKQNELHELSNQRNAIQIELARLEEREQNLLREIEIEIRDAELASKIKQERTVETVDTDALYPEIQKLKNQLELIGGIDPETMAEYEEIKSRHEFLDTQTKDLQGAIRSTEKIIDELDAKIKDQSEKAFKEINREFQRYFKLLFGGGSCSLVKMTRDDVEEEETEAETTTERVRERLAGKRDTVIGIDIQATPPGKKLKALNLLSGGERTLTSIALLAAIMATNASPFVVLDEVDAALDEANTLRFASILGELAKLTQFIVITHNRATMEKSDVLYGVTMGDDGVSHLLSVNMEEVDPEAVKK
ncbi:AAA family ATPase [Patescibacteria group bacterium]|nr:AAA family ATPase [Patescibacteria group bacterium]MBU1906908.1 AAA family ATPase [Patescibacteria group bacterium]